MKIETAYWHEVPEVRLISPEIFVRLWAQCVPWVRIIRLHLRLYCAASHIGEQPFDDQPNEEKTQLRFW